MTRYRIVNDKGLDIWVCCNCLMKYKDIEYTCIDQDNNEYGEGCNHCDCGSDELDCFED